jgi:hypothetical protein
MLMISMDLRIFNYKPGQRFMTPQRWPRWVTEALRGSLSLLGMSRLLLAPSLVKGSKPGKDSRYNLLVQFPRL